MDILLVVMVFLSGFIFGWLRASKGMLDRMLNDPDKMVQLLNAYKKAKKEAEEEEQGRFQPTRKIKVERHDDMLYLFAEDTDEFLAQGKTLQEALDVVEKRFPNNTFVGHLTKNEADDLGITVK